MIDSFYTSKYSLKFSPKESLTEIYTKERNEKLEYYTVQLLQTSCSLSVMDYFIQKPIFRILGTKS